MSVLHRESQQIGARGVLSQAPAPIEDRLIVALDVPTHDEARAIVELLGSTVNFYKLGFEIFLAGNYLELVRWLIEEQRKKVFVDLKIYEIPETVRRSIAQLNRVGASFVTVHGNDTMLKAACEVKQDLKVLAVTVMTSLDQTDIEEFGYHDVGVAELVQHRARKALMLGCDGVISSGQEAPALRAEFGDQLLIVTPGIRSVANDIDERPFLDDQKRTVTVREAFERGADYIVLGRPIRDSANPAATAARVQQEIHEILSS